MLAGERNSDREPVSCPRPSTTTKTPTFPLLKNKTIAILGYGSQGHGHAQNLRDSGCNVIVAELPGTANYEQAVKDGFQPPRPARRSRRATSSRSSCPTKSRATSSAPRFRDNLSPGNILVCSHGFNYHFGQFDIPKGVSAILSPPRVLGTWSAPEYVRAPVCPACSRLGKAGDEARKIGLAYAKGIGGTRAWVIETTFAEETEPTCSASRSSLRRTQRADQGRIRDARRGRLPAGNGLLRMSTKSS